MSPQVTAAIIAGSGVVLTVIATVITQRLGLRATSKDVDKRLKAEDEHLKTQLEEQREQLNTTLAAQGEQLNRTLDEQRTRTLNERFATAAGQLGSDKPPAVRLAGVYAMAGLADDWEDKRQTCVDVLCGYLRLPYDPDPGDEAPAKKRLAFRASQEVRRTVIRVITAHLRAGAKPSWQGLDLDFTGVIFDGGDFSDAEFSGGKVSFLDTQFPGRVDFDRARFSGGTVNFEGARFSAGGSVSFLEARFSGGEVIFFNARFSGGSVGFLGAEFSDGKVIFNYATFSGGVDFTTAKFSGGTVNFINSGFHHGITSFWGAVFSGGTVSFDRAKFYGSGEVSFDRAEFSGGEVIFPPAFPWTGTPPPGVKLPKKEDQSQA